MGDLTEEDAKRMAAQVREDLLGAKIDDVTLSVSPVSTETSGTIWIIKVEGLVAEGYDLPMAIPEFVGPATVDRVKAKPKVQIGISRL